MRNFNIFKLGLYSTNFLAQFQCNKILNKKLTANNFLKIIFCVQFETSVIKNKHMGFDDIIFNEFLYHS